MDNSLDGVLENDKSPVNFNGDGRFEAPSSQSQSSTLPIPGIKVICLQHVFWKAVASAAVHTAKALGNLGRRFQRWLHKKRKRDWVAGIPRHHAWGSLGKLECRQLHLRFTRNMHADPSLGVSRTACCCFVCDVSAVLTADNDKADGCPDFIGHTAVWESVQWRWTQSKREGMQVIRTSSKKQLFSSFCFHTG